LITSRSWRAWSCSVRLLIDAKVMDQASADLVDLLAEVDRAASRFRLDSELTHANQCAVKPVPISRLLTSLVASSLAAADYTEGAVDATIGSALIRRGYNHDIALLPRAHDRVDPEPRVADGREVHLDRNRGILTVPVGVALDLGASAKAATADRAARLLSERSAVPVLAEIGGDLAVAGVPDNGWIVAVAEREGSDDQDVPSGSGGLSTTTIRRLWRGDQRAHHIIDPASGCPAQEDGGRRRLVGLAANVASICLDRARPARLASSLIGSCPPG
jgi:thiamine biosynthesis lipoprotein